MVIEWHYGLVVPKLSAGLLPFRHRGTALEVFLVHPGGPFWAHKDAGAWSVAKGEYEPGEDPWDAAQREFAEEVGIPAPVGEITSLGEIKQSSGKVISVFAVVADFEIDAVVSNTFTLEWPRRSGQLQEFPEVDAARWMELSDARRALVGGQLGFLDRLVEQVSGQRTD